MPLVAHTVLHILYIFDSVVVPRLQYLQSRSANEVSGLQNKVVPFKIPVEPNNMHNSVRQGRIVEWKDDADLEDLNEDIFYRA